MKTSKYSDSLIMIILKQAEAGTPVPNLCREHGMSAAPFITGALNMVVWMLRLL